MTSQYLSEILSQPEALRAGLSEWKHSLDKVPRLDALTEGQHAAAKYDRIVMTGMGASLMGIYPAWRRLASAGLPAVWVETAELLGLVRPTRLSEINTTEPTGRDGRTLLWMVSQSGRSAEIVALLERQLEIPLIGSEAQLLAITNEPDSPLGKAAAHSGLRLLLNVIPEKTASTRSYVNTLALAGLTARLLVGEAPDETLACLEKTAAALESYLNNWQQNYSEIEAVAGVPRHLALIGRGDSLATALTGALELEEAARFATLGMSAAQFRHGPLELAGPDLTVFVFAGQGSERALNARLARDLSEKGARTVWIDSYPSEFDEPAAWPGLKVTLPSVPEIGLPVLEIAAVQLLSLHLARLTGFEPGVFKHIGKVTETL
jgi:glutamine---fructose-6-phosphate transaminase (isomerizing)